MPIWSEILTELQKTSQTQGGIVDFDRVRRKYLQELYEHTGRNIILYASGWLQKSQIFQQSPEDILISDEDIHALMEVSNGLRGSDLDLILHSPGGSAEAAEALVSYLRSRFSHVRVIVPQLAMSAAAMMTCSADEIVLGKHSFLGPTDPQIPLATNAGLTFVPAQTVLDQFEKAKRECVDPANLPAWLPMLDQFGPSLLVRCETALELSKELVKTWLENYMFKGDSDSAMKADKIASWLADHQHFKSHGRHIPRTELRRRQLKIANLEDDEMLQDLSLSVFHAAAHTFTGAPAVKIVENHTGRAFIKNIGLIPTPPPQNIPVG